MIPHDAEAEASILGAALLTGGRALEQLAITLEPSEFYSPANRAVWEAMISLQSESKPIDTVTVGERLRAHGVLDKLNSNGGVEYLVTLMGQAVTFSNLEFHARLVKNKALRRRWIVTATQIAAAGQDETDDQEFFNDAQSALSELLHTQDLIRAQPVKVILHEFLRVVDERFQNKSPTGVITGFDKLDVWTGGLQREDLVILAARPSMGKTALALNAAVESARRGHPALFISLEMSAQSLVERMVAAGSEINSRRIRTAQLDRGQFPALTAACSKLAEIPLWIADAGAPTIGEICTLIRAWHSKRARGQKPAVVFVDYLQLLRPDRRQKTQSPQSRENEVADISRRLKALAKELHIPVVALSQLNRSLESRNDKRPTLADLRESGALEQDSDVVLLLYRDEHYNRDSEHKGKAELNLGKHRNGPTGVIELRWKPEYCLFTGAESHSPSELPL